MSRFGPLLLFIALVASWEAACVLLQVPTLVAPRPGEVALVLWQELASGRMLRHFAVTAGEMLLGLALAVAFGLAAGVALAESPTLRRYAQPYLVATQVIPKLALAPLFLLWFGFGMRSIVIITALVCFFPLLENTVTGLDRAGPGQRELFRMLRAGRLQTLLRLKFPSGLPVILAGFRVAVVLSLVGAVVGEFIMGREGLGASVVAAQGMMDTSLMFALFVAITALGSAVYQAALLLERRLLHRKDLAP
ncbi:MAG: ABC transporter permease [Chelatococcus sp.]|nr:MAG: ABC transporter permease [Chelatococcus sp.]